MSTCQNCLGEIFTKNQAPLLYSGVVCICAAPKVGLASDASGKIDFTFAPPSLSFPNLPAGNIYTMPKVASKNDQSKADLALVPQVALIAAARAFEVGEKKYGRYNYYKGHKASQLIAAMLRHASAWMEGEENDPTDGQPHLGSVIACASMLLQQQKLGTLIDNRYKPEEDK